MQQELQDLNKRLHEEEEGEEHGHNEGVGREIDRLKEEFTQLITTLQKRRIAEGQNVLSDEVIVHL